MPVHAHTLAAGWLMSSVFAFFYHLFPGERKAGWRRCIFWADGRERHLPADRLLLPARRPWSVEPLVAASSMVFYAAMLLSMFIALPAIYRQGKPDGHLKTVPRR